MESTLTTGTARRTSGSASMPSSPMAYFRYSCSAMVASPPTFWAKRYFSGFCDALRAFFCDALGAFFCDALRALFCDALRAFPLELLRLELRERLPVPEFELLLRELVLLLRALV